MKSISLLALIALTALSLAAWASLGIAPEGCAAPELTSANATTTSVASSK